jgi:hypothetical protein
MKLKDLILLISRRFGKKPKGLITKEQAIKLLFAKLEPGQTAAGRLEMVSQLLDPSCRCITCECDE